MSNPPTRSRLLDVVVGAALLVGIMAAVTIAITVVVFVILGIVHLLSA